MPRQLQPEFAEIEQFEYYLLDWLKQMIDNQLRHRVVEDNPLFSLLHRVRNFFGDYSAEEFQISQLKIVADIIQELLDYLQSIKPTI